MTIRTKEPDFPSQLPPGRLFLDDIEEIVRILREIIESQEVGPYSKVPDLKLTLKFEIGNKECDDLLDLPKLTRSIRTNKLDITVGRAWAKTSLSFDYFSSRFGSYGLSEESKWQAFRKVEAVLEERRSRWRAFANFIPFWLLSFAGLLFFPLIGLLRFLLKQIMPVTPAFVVSLVLVVGLWGSLMMGRVFHTTIILRRSHEPSPFRQGLRDKLPAALIGAALGSILTFLLTLLGFYLKHKYWP